MPAIFIGIGGIGGGIVTEIRQELKTRVAFAGDTPAARERAANFRFLLVETDETEHHHGFDPSEIFVIPGGSDMHRVNQRTSQLMASDPPFQDWWPANPEGEPLRVGDFNHGAGQLRLKGKLAYRISLGNSRNVVAAVSRALNSIQDVLRTSDGGAIVKIYLVSSLGGGTGSGITLALAQHLYQEMPVNCRLVGVFPLASITELALPPSQRASIRANTDAALREIDYAQRVDTTRDYKLNPYLSWNNQDIRGSEPPFQYSYLFGRENTNGLSLKDIKDYIHLIAETIVAESFSNMTAGEGLNNHILSPHSNFIQHIEANTRIGERSTAYASAAIATLVYPAERIERHLGRRYGIAVLDRMVKVDENRVTSITDEFLKKELLTWEENPSFWSKFEESIENSNGTISVVPSFRKMTRADDDKYLEQKQSQLIPFVNQAKTDLEKWAGEDYAGHLRKRRNLIVAEYAKPDQGIRELAQTMLVEDGPAALGLTYAVVGEIRKRLDQQWHIVNKALEGDPDAAIPTEGSKKDLAALREAWDAQQSGLRKGFGRVRNRDGKDAKARFYKNAWVPLREQHLLQERLLAARPAYSDLIKETQDVERALKELIDQLDALRNELVVATKVDVGEHGAAGVLDLAVLDNPKLIAHKFDDLLKEVRDSGMDKCAKEVTAYQVPDDDEEVAPGEVRVAKYEGIVLNAFRDKVSNRGHHNNQIFRDQLGSKIVGDGVERLGNRVRGLSIWDALVAEYDACLSLGMQDDATIRAATNVDEDRKAASDRGIASKDWHAEGVKYFISNKLDQCQNRSRPFWELNSIMPSAFPTAPAAYGFVVLAADEQAYKEASTRLNIGDVLESTSERLGAGSYTPLPGRDRVVFYSREGGVPLFYLSDRELRSLRDSYHVIDGQGKFLYTDKRFSSGVDDVIRPHEDEQAIRQFAIAMGLQRGIIMVNEDWTIAVTNDEWPFEETEFATVTAFDRMLEKEPEVYAAFVSLVNREIQDIRVSGRRLEVLDAHKRIHELRNGARKIGRAEASFWREVETSVQIRLDYGRYLIDA